MLTFALLQLSVKNLPHSWQAVKTVAKVCLTTTMLALSWLACASDNGVIGDTQVAHWKDNRTAAFLLMFDDSYPSHWQVAAPELVKRNMIATFYINPGKGEYKKFANEWEDKLWRQGMVYGDHTMTHQGVKDINNAEWEIGECARVIRKISPGKEQRLVSFGLPGVGPKDWNISNDQFKALLEKYHLINRPTFDKHGAVYHLKTTADMLALADKAIQTKGLEYLVIHGVERIIQKWDFQDFWALKQDVFLPLLDGLKERSDRNELWITDHISAHQYATERDSAKIKILEASDSIIRLELSSQADPQYYDYPLTLITTTPKHWQQVTITQGDAVRTVPVTEGVVHLDAVPGQGSITIKPSQG